MCMIDGAEMCEVWQERPVKAARKAHKCSECGRTIAAGETYRSIFTVFEGDASTVRQCQHCVVAADWLTKECGGYLTEGIFEDIDEHAREYARFGLWRLSVGMKRRWQRFDKAGLMRVPALPPITPPSPHA